MVGLVIICGGACYNLWWGLLSFVVGLAIICGGASHHLWWG